jgi:predicted nucleic acid-binding protein
MTMSKGVFVDTSGWIALLNADDHLHGPAVQVLAQLGGDRTGLVTTDWVLAETGNGLARTPARRQLMRAVQTFQRSPQARLLRISGKLFQQALGLYHQSHDKTWGLIDCASFLVMRREGMVEALTADRHFQQAGFRCLLPVTI